MLAVAPSVAAGMTRSSQRQDPTFAELESELGESVNSFEEITTYNNFYEFGTNKEDPYRNSGSFQPRPWTVEVGGMVNNPGTFELDEYVDNPAAYFPGVAMAFAGIKDPAERHNLLEYVIRTGVGCETK